MNSKNDRAELEAFLAGLAIGKDLKDYSPRIAAIAYDDYQSGAVPRQAISTMANLVEEAMPEALQFRQLINQAQAEEAVKH